MPRRHQQIHRLHDLATTGTLFLAVYGCAFRNSPTATRATPASPAVTTILREASYEDSDLTARNRGRLEVVVRSTDRPTQALPSAQVLVRMGQRDALARLTDERGMAVFDSLEVGEHELVVRRLGYGLARAIVPIQRGCRTDAEAYIAVQSIGIAPPPAMPGRVTLTTCR